VCLFLSPDEPIHLLIVQSAITALLSYCFDSFQIPVRQSSPSRNGLEAYNDYCLHCRSQLLPRVCSLLVSSEATPCQSLLVQQVKEHPQAMISLSSATPALCIWSRRNHNPKPKIVSVTNYDILLQDRTCTSSMRSSLAPIQSVAKKMDSRRDNLWRRGSDGFSFRAVNHWCIVGHQRAGGRSITL